MIIVLHNNYINMWWLVLNYDGTNGKLSVFHDDSIIWWELAVNYEATDWW